MTFPCNVHFEAELPSSRKLHDVEREKKSDILFLLHPHPLSPAHPFSICLSHTFMLSFLLSRSRSLSWPTCAFFPQQQSITSSTSSPRSRAIWTMRAPSFPFCLTVALYFTSSPSPLADHLTSHLLSAFPYLRFSLWLGDKYHFGEPPQVAAFSFPGWNGFSAYLHCLWSYRTSPAYSTDFYILHRYSRRARGERFWDNSSTNLESMFFPFTLSPRKCVFFTFILVVKGHRIIVCMCSALKWQLQCEKRHIWTFLQDMPPCYYDQQQSIVVMHL